LEQALNPGGLVRRQDYGMPPVAAGAQKMGFSLKKRNFFRFPAVETLRLS